MMNKPKVGFLTGSPGGNPTGIFQDYILPLDTAGIRAVVGCLDGDVGISDILALNSNVPHVMYFRVVRDRSEGTSVPEYHHPPDVAARLHWDKIRPHIAPSVVANRDRIWITPINEPNVLVGDWLGWFSIEIGKIMRAEGFKQAAFGWAAGQPGEDHQEVEFWETPGILAYLRMCEQDPEYYGIALHEGSFTIDHLNIDQWHIGRFEFLHEACDRNGIKRPPILITEFAWEMNKVPSTNVAMEHLRPVAEYYAGFPNILGIFLWCLCKYEDGKIANMVNKLIQPVKEFTLVTVYDDPAVEPEPPEEPPMTTTIKHLAKVHESTPLNPDATHVRVILSENVGTPEVSEWKRMTTTDIPIPASANPKQIRLMLLQITEEEEEGDEEPDPTSPPGPGPPEGSLFIDVSHWNDVDLEALQGIAGVAIRTSNGIRKDSDSTDTAGIDRKMWRYVKQAWELGLPFRLWHYLNENYGEVEQVTHFMGVVQAVLDAGYTPSMGLYLDCEGGNPGAGIAGAPRTEAGLKAAFTALVSQNVHGFEVGCYSGGNFWNPIVPPTAAWPGELGLKLWVAAYPFGHEEPAGYPATDWKPFILNGFSRVDSWQWTSTGGKLVGHTVVNLDLNFVGGNAPGELPVAGKFAIGDRVQVTAAAGLNVRAIPNGDLLGAQPAGSLGTIAGGPQTDGDFAWWQVGYDTGPDGWSVENWLERAVETPPGAFAFTAWPTEYKVITQDFGANPAAYAQFGLPGHEGIDIKALHDTPVYAVAAGTVYAVGDDRVNKANGGHNYGVRVYIRHGDSGYRTAYAHLNSRQVNVGDTVAAGQQIGRADNTGNSFGSHLHLTLYKDGAAGNGYPLGIIDPTPFLMPLLGSTTPVATVDVLPYIKGVHRRQFDMGYAGGTQTTQVWHLDTNNWLYIKGENGEYERLGLRTWQGQEWIFRFEDTSESPTRFYAHYNIQGGGIGAPWFPRHAEVGKWYETPKFVQHYAKAGCTPLNSNSITDRIRLVLLFGSKTYSQSGQTLQDVITLEWGGGEQYDFCGGNVGFRDADRNFWFIGWLEGRADKPFKKPDCIDLGW